MSKSMESKNSTLGITAFTLSIFVWVIGMIRMPMPEPSASMMLILVWGMFYNSCCTSNYRFK